MTEKDKGQETLAMLKTKFVGDVYVHWKGGHYVCYSMSLDEETLEPLVHYYSLAKKSWWTRTLYVWLEVVKGDPRFIYLRKATQAELEEAKG